MLIVRYDDGKNINDIEVSLANAYYVFQNAKKLYGHADLIFIENGTEYCWNQERQWLFLTT